MNSPYLIFFDDTCPFCRSWIAWIYERDVQRLFLFAPLKGTTFAQTIKNGDFYLEQDTILLVEDPFSESPKINIRAQAVRKILWALGRGFRVLAWISFLFPRADRVYHWIASRRNTLGSSQNKILSLPKDRLLP